MKFYWVRPDFVINLEAIRKVDVAGRAVCLGDSLPENWLLLNQAQFDLLMEALGPHMVNQEPEP